MVRVLVKKSSLNVKKGAWSREEDIVLRECIDKYMPDIKRGDFEEEEVDLVLRLHKLLGNRQVWSLIAGRIPGRTANDVKNYWNTHQRKTDGY
ncbi:hypothetical protein G4B88_019348 [Cannabis sativa]|uniref:Uncharacterized protein n=1 Tax=Cannabis sativa TaxID=3483 RepID=A0A7J6DP88_CANSA|nr:hypothetical protein G4B88_019348 [Cannabis sativa]